MPTPGRPSRPPGGRLERPRPHGPGQRFPVDVGLDGEERLLLHVHAVGGGGLGDREAHRRPQDDVLEGGAVRRGVDFFQQLAVSIWFNQSMSPLTSDCTEAAL